MGPKANAGKKDKAPTITITERRRSAKRLVSVEKVPSEGGVLFFWERHPASAILGITIDNRDKIITIPKTQLLDVAFAGYPAKELPLFPAAEVKA